MGIGKNGDWYQKWNWKVVEGGMLGTWGLHIYIL